MLPAQKVKLVRAFYKQVLTTSGQDKNNSAYLDLDLPEAREWGPYIESVRAHSCTEGRTTNFRWRVVVFWSFDQRQWSSVVEVADITGVGDAISSAYTTASTFGLNMRWAVQPYNETGTNVERGICSLVLEFVFKS